MKVLICICMTRKRDIHMSGFNFKLSFRDSCNNADTNSLFKPVFFFLNDGFSCLCVRLQAVPSPMGGFEKKWNQEFLSEQQDLGASLREGVIVQHFHHNARHMENRRISHWLPARAKANTNPHMHRSGHLEQPRFTITTDETQESFCFPEEALFAGLATSQAGSVCGRINLGAQALV